MNRVDRTALLDILIAKKVESLAAHRAEVAAARAQGREFSREHIEAHNEYAAQIHKINCETGKVSTRNYLTGPIFGNGATQRRIANRRAEHADLQHRIAKNAAKFSK